MLPGQEVSKLSRVEAGRITGGLTNRVESDQEVFKTQEFGRVGSGQDPSPVGSGQIRRFSNLVGWVASGRATPTRLNPRKMTQPMKRPGFFSGFRGYSREWPASPCNCDFRFSRYASSLTFYLFCSGSESLLTRHGGWHRTVGLLCSVFAIKAPLCGYVQFDASRRDRSGDGY